MFTTGLGEPLHTNVELAAPADSQSAMRLAQAYESCLTTTKMGAKQPTSVANRTMTPSTASSSTVASTL
jgi:hypothetical protein